MYITPDQAKRNLAINLWWNLSHQKGRTGYAWLATELSKRYPTRIYTSRIQKVLEQTCSPDWAFVVNLADILHISVEDLGREPTAAMIKAYELKFGAKGRDMAHSA